MKTAPTGPAPARWADALPEIGYTPANLRALMTLCGWTSAGLAAHLNVSPRSVQRWRADIGHPSHRDMDSLTWRFLLEDPPPTAKAHDDHAPPA